MRSESARSNRLVTVALIGVLASLAAFGLSAAWTTNHAARRARDSTALSDAYGEARYAVAGEESLERKYRLEPGGNVRTLFDATATSLVSALDRAAARADGKDRVIIDGVLVRHTAYLRAIDRMFAAVDAKETKRVLAIDGGEVDPAFSVIAQRVNDAAEAHRRASSSTLAALGRPEQMVLIATPLVFALGLLLVGWFSVRAARYRARLARGRRAELDRLGRAALHDELTGLGNRRAFEEQLAQTLALCQRTDAPIAMGMIDLVGLKQLNDTFGYQAGDERLRAVGDCLKSTTRGDASAYRLGGDEFAVILPATRAWGAQDFGQRLLANLGSDKPVSIGVAEQPSSVASRDDLLANADLAMLEAKGSRRGVVVYSEDLRARPTTREAQAEERHVDTLATALARAVDAKDSYTRSHCETVSATCALIATQLGLPPERVRRIRLGGLLHDVGKIGIPDAILQKPAKLTDPEFEVMKTHSTLGQRIVGGAGLQDEAKWIRHHHERPDGRGYPDGLRGAELPLESRIILVADAFEAMTSDRPYRAGRPEHHALEELQDHAGSQFDPNCVTALKRVILDTSSDAPPHARAA